MAGNTGMLRSYSNADIKDRGIAQAIWNLDYQEVPLLHLLDVGDSNKNKFRLRGYPSYKIEWYEDTNAPKSTTIDGAHNDSVTTLNVASGTGQYYRQGDLLLLNGSEKALVTSRSTDALTLDGRGYGTSTAAAYSGGESVVKIGRIMPEGSDPVTGYTTEPTLPYNYHQIISQSLKMTKTALAVKNIPIESEFDYQAGKLFDNGGTAGELAEELANIYYYGERVERDADNYGSAGGFKTFVTTNKTNASSKKLSLPIIHNMLRNIRGYNGMVTHALMNGYQYEACAGLYDGQRTMTQESKFGGAELETILTPHGRVKLVYDHNMPTNEIHFLNLERIAIIPLRKWERTVIKDQGDYYEEDIVGEYTLALRNEKSFGYIYGLKDS